MASTTPTIQRLPREQFSWVTAVFMSFLFERAEIGEPPGAHEEILDEIDIDNLPEEAVESVKRLILSSSHQQNYQLHQADYELAEDEELLEWFRGESSVDGNLTGAEHMEKLYDSIRD